MSQQHLAVDVVRRQAVTDQDAAQLLAAKGLQHRQLVTVAPAEAERSGTSKSRATDLRQDNGSNVIDNGGQIISTC